MINGWNVKWDFCPRILRAGNALGFSRQPLFGISCILSLGGYRQCGAELREWGTSLGFTVKKFDICYLDDMPRKASIDAPGAQSIISS